MTATKSAEHTVTEDPVPYPSDDDTDEATTADADGVIAKDRRRFDWRRLVVYGLLPAIALLVTVGAGFLKWQMSTARDDGATAVESVQAAKDSTIALLSYQPNTVDQQLGAARELLTGDFRDSYTQLANDVVIPGAKQQQISAAASIPAAASVSAHDGHAVVMVFVNQTTTIGGGAPSNTISSIRVTMDRVDGRWLISQFDPV